jgi:hypothetical protein
MDGISLHEAGAKRRISGERARQIEQAAIKKVRKANSLPEQRRRRKRTDIDRLAERYANAPRQARVLRLTPEGTTVTDFEGWIASLVDAFRNATPEERREAWLRAGWLPIVWRERAKRRE